MNNASSFLGLNMLESLLHPQVEDEEIDIAAEMEKEDEFRRDDSKNKKATNRNSGNSGKRVETSKRSNKTTRQSKK